MSGPRTLFKGIVFLFFLFSSNVFGFWLRKLLSATKATKNNLKTSEKKTKKTKKNKGFWGMSRPRTMFRGIVFLFFWFSSIFLVFGSGSFYRLLKLPKTQKPRKKNKNKQQKKQRIVRNVWAKDFLQRHWQQKRSSTTFFGSRYKNSNRNEWHKNTGFKEMWEPIYGMIAFVFLCCVFPLLNIPDK